jgi:hypothetical protein
VGTKKMGRFITNSPIPEIGKIGSHYEGDIPISIYKDLRAYRNPEII